MAVAGMSCTDHWLLTVHVAHCYLCGWLMVAWYASVPVQPPLAEKVFALGMAAMVIEVAETVSWLPGACPQSHARTNLVLLQTDLEVQLALYLSYFTYTCQALHCANYMDILPILQLSTTRL